MNAFLTTGWHIVALGRRPPMLPGVEYRHYSIEEPPSTSLVAGLDSLVHAAYSLDADIRGSDENVNATVALSNAAMAAGVKAFAFISSLAADPAATSRYGINKYRAEMALDGSKSIIIRPGLVAGNGGLYATMRNNALRFGVAPVFGDGKQPVYLVDAEELSAAVVHLVEARWAGLAVCAASEPIAMADLYDAMASASKRRIRKVHLPLNAVRTVVSLAERCGMRLSISSETIRGVENLRVITRRPPNAAGIIFTSAEQCVAWAERYFA